MWLKENLANIIIIVHIAVLLYLCVRSLVRQKKAGLPSCACGKNCATCALRCQHSLPEHKIS